MYPILAYAFRFDPLIALSKVLPPAIANCHSALSINEEQDSIILLIF